MSQGIRRIFINSYLDYSLDPNEGLSEFNCSLPDSVIGASNIQVGLVSLNFTPLRPNIPPKESTLEMEYDGTTASQSIDTQQIYQGVVAISGLAGTDLITQLNDGFKAAFSTAYEPWSYDANIARIVFTAEPAKDFTFLSGTTLARRIGLASGDIGVAQGAGAVFIATNQPIISRTQMLQVISDIDASAITNTGVSNQILFSIPIDNPQYGSIITYQPSFARMNLQRVRDFSSIRFKILDDEFDEILFTSNAQLLMNLYVEQPEESNEEGQLKLPRF